MKTLIATLALIVLAGASAHAESNREGKRFDITASPFGLSWIGDFSTSQELSFAFHINDDDLIRVAVESYPETGSDYSDKVKAAAIGVFYQRYLSNSFNAKVGITQGRYEFTQRQYDNTISDYRRTHYDTNVTTLEGRIGNQWTWGSFTLGCDWFGFSTPFNSTVTRDDGHFSGVPASTWLRFVQFNLGVSF